MFWIFVATAGYLLGALAIVTDKFLIVSRRLSHPAGYAFLTSLFSLFALVFAWFEPATLDWPVRLLSLGSGVLFVYGLFFFYSALEEYPVSAAAPLVGIVSALTALSLPLAFSIFSNHGGQDILLGLLAFGLFVAGGFLIAFDLPLDKRLSVRWKNIFLAGFLMSSSFLVLKYGYAVSGLPFFGSVVWSRLGFFLGGCSLLAVPILRTEIVKTLRTLFAPSARQRNSTTGVIFLSNKILGGSAVLLVNWAMFLGPVSLVQSMDSLRFAFVFLLARFLAKPFPEIFGERLFFWDWVQKWGALVLLALALWLASRISVGGLPILS